MTTEGEQLPPRAHFATTRRTLVRSARLDGDEAARAALGELEGEYAARGMTELFTALRPRLVPGGEGEPLADLAVRLARSEGSLETSVHRLRRRQGEPLRRAIGDTVEDPEEIGEEIERLFRALSGERS